AVVRAGALQAAALELREQAAERERVRIQHRHVMALALELLREPGSDPSAAHDDDPHVVPRSVLASAPGRWRLSARTAPRCGSATPAPRRARARTARAVRARTGRRAGGSRPPG